LGFGCYDIAAYGTGLTRDDGLTSWLSPSSPLEEEVSMGLLAFYLLSFGRVGGGF
jgi:hypothetical protein